MNNSENTYREILQKSINRINDEIILLEIQNNKLINIVGSSEKRIEQLKLEKEQMLNELKSRIETKQTKVDGIATEFIDDRIKDIANKGYTHSERIKELESLKSQVNSNISRAIINKKINNERMKLVRLRNATNLVSDIQKAMILSKHAVDKYRLRKYAKRQGNVNYYENQVNKIENLQSKLNPEENIVDKVKAAYYDMKGNHYAKKLDKSTRLLEKLQQKEIRKHILGANVAAISKKAADKLRKRMQSQTKVEPEKENQQEIKIEKQQPQEQRQLPAVISTTPIPENITAASLAEEAVNNASNSMTSTQARVA